MNRIINIIYVFILIISSIGSSQAQVTVTVPNSNADQGSVIDIPLNVTSIGASDNVISYQFDVLFDSQVLKVLGASKDGTITPASWSFVLNPNYGDGIMRVGAYGITDDLTGAGVLSFLQFEVIGQSGETSTVSLANFIFNAGSPAVSIQNGTFSVNSIQININTSPPNLNFEYDGVLYSAPQTFYVGAGSEHSVDVPDPQNDGPSARHLWSSWSDGLSKSHNITAPGSGSVSITANFTRQYKLEVTVDPGGAGVVTKNPDSEWYNSGTEVELTVTANNGYDFSSWGGGLTGSTNPQSLTMNAGKNVTALFTAWPEITLETSPSGLQIRIDGSYYRAPRVYSWQPGSVHTVSLNSPQAGGSATRYLYSNWSDGGDQDRQIITPSSSTTYTANFDTQFSLTTAVSPSGAGTVDRNPDESWYDDGTQVQLNGNPNSGYGFMEWNGDLSGNNSSQLIIINSAKSVTALFGLVRNVTINTDPVLMNFEADGVSYMAPHTFLWFEGSSHSVNISQVINEGSQKRYVWTHWSDYVSRNRNIVVPGSDMTITAFFDTQYHLNISISPSGAGSVNYSSDWYLDGQTLDLIATPFSDYEFVNWSGDVSGSGNTAQLHMISAKNITANFILSLVQITITTNPGGYPIFVDGVQYSSPRQFDWNPGSDHEIRVDLYYDIRQGERIWWQNWSDNGSRSHYISVPDYNRSYTANLRTKYELQITSQKGSPTGAGWYWDGDNAYVTVETPIYQNNKTRFTFGSWSGDFSGSNPEADILMNRPKTINANWDTQYYLEVFSNRFANSDNIGIYEAEDGEVTFPSYIKNDSSASNNAYVVSDERHLGKIRIPFVVENESDFYIWGRVYALSDVEDSFWLLIDESQDTITWPIGPTYNKWYWKNLNNTEPDVNEFHFTPGEHQLNFYTREKHSRMDKIVITNDPNYYPEGISGYVDPEKYLGNPQGSGWYYPGENVNFSIESPIIISDTDRFMFLFWSGDYNGDKLSDFILMDSPKYVSALFITQHFVSLGISPANSGSTIPPVPGGWFNHDSTLEISAQPGPGFEFSSWSGNITGSDSIFSVLINGTKKIIANFVVKNNKPVVRDLVLSPPFLLPGQELTGTYTYFDLDNDPEGESIIKWYKNGINIIDLDNQTIVPGDSSNLGDVWQFMVIPFDNRNYGESVFSDPVFVLSNSPDSLITFYWTGPDTSITFGPDSAGLLIDIVNNNGLSLLSEPNKSSAGNFMPQLISICGSKGSDLYYFDNTIRYYWRIYTTLTDYNSTLTFRYNGSQLNEAGISNEENLRIGWTENFGSDWNYIPDTIIDINTNIIQARDINHFSMWAIGIPPFSNFLPVELISFVVTSTNEAIVELNWSTASETNNYGFQIERKYIGTEFGNVAFISGHGTTNEPQHYQFIDNVEHFGTYYYRLKQIDLDGSFTYSAVKEVSVNNPVKFDMIQNYPNPFNRSTIIQFTISQKLEGQDAAIFIFDITGKEVRRFIHNSIKAGSYSDIWNGKNSAGIILSSGVYFYTIRVGNIRKNKKMLFVQ